MIIGIHWQCTAVPQLLNVCTYKTNDDDVLAHCTLDIRALWHILPVALWANSFTYIADQSKMPSVHKHVQDWGNEVSVLTICSKCHRFFRPIIWTLSFCSSKSPKINVLVLHCLLLKTAILNTVILLKCAILSAHADLSSMQCYWTASVSLSVTPYVQTCPINNYVRHTCIISKYLNTLKAVSWLLNVPLITL